MDPNRWPNLRCSLIKKRRRENQTIFIPKAQVHRKEINKLPNSNYILSNSTKLWKNLSYDYIFYKKFYYS